MNQIELMRNRNEIAQLIRIGNRHKNVLRWGSGETDEHIQMKLEICKYLKKLGEEFYTEPIFVDGSGRADIIASDRRQIIEVYNTETEKSLKEKKNKYPSGLEIIFVNANQKFNEKLIL